MTTAVNTPTGGKVFWEDSDLMVMMLTDDGLAATGTNNKAIGNYAGAVEEFYRGPSASNRALVIHRIMIYIEDVGSFRQEKYGALAAALTNGVNLCKLAAPGGAVIENYSPLNVKTNGQWSRLCYDTRLNSWGGGNLSLASRYTFSKFGRPVGLTGTEVFAARINDDLTGLIDHSFIIEGYEVTI